MEYTSQYQLNQWDRTDRIRMEDFNADNLKLEQALAGLQTAVAGCGNCKIWTTTYTGNGSTSAAHSITFPAKPIAVMLSNAHGDGRTSFWNGMERTTMINNSYSMSLTWSGNTVSWYSSSGADQMFNRSGTTYVVVALLSTDA